MFHDFPAFNGWPSRKVFFLENMAWHHYSPSSDDESYVVIEEKRQNDSDFSRKCVMCNEKLCMVFRHDIEEWVFDRSKEYDGDIVHFPICYQFRIRQEHK